MTAAEPEGGDAVHVEADIHGHHVESQAWVRPDTSTRRLEWGAEGPDDYHGELDVVELSPERSRITVSLYSVRDADADEVRAGLEQTVATVIRTAAADR